MSFEVLTNSNNSTMTALKVREDRQKRTNSELLRIGMIYLGIELLFSLEIALTVPILLEAKVSESIYSYVYFISPLLGFLFQPVLGEMSDRCECSFGRRRPFILALAISSFIGIALILNGRLVGEWIGDSNFTAVSNKFPLIGVTLIFLGVTLLDFSADSCDSPLRAYLLDTCNYQDQHLALNLHAFVGGVGGALGYILSAVNWRNSFLSFIGNEFQILFVIVAFVFFTCLVITLTAAKEEQFVNNLLRKKESYEKVETSVQTNYESSVAEKFNTNTTNTTLNNNSSSISSSSSSRSNSFKQDSYLCVLMKSYFNMPKELNRLYICETLGWLSFYSTTLFFTDFIAHTIYNGDPLGAENSVELFMYEYGTKMGSWCLLIYSISSAVSAIIIENFLIEKYSTKAIFSFAFLFYIFCCAAIYQMTSIYAIFPFVTSFGIMLTCLTTLPYNLVSEFHQDSLYVYSNKSGNKRGIGVDCSLLCSCHFLSQIIVSSFMSYLTSHYGNKVILIVGGFFASLGFVIVHFFVIFPKRKR